jgi:ribosomal protein S18 acetylase RimI-like enzyme
MVTTRPATPDDKELLRRIHHAAYRDVVEREFGPWVEAEQDGWFDKGFVADHFRIVELDRVAVGSIATTEADDHVFLGEVQILPEYQNRGIGSELVIGELAHAKSLGKPLRLQVLRANDRARALYERLGFRLIGETEHHFQMISG